MVLGSPRPATLSVVAHSLAGVRARYVQPYEDAMLHNGVFLLDVKIERIDRTADGFNGTIYTGTGIMTMVGSIVAVLSLLNQTGTIGMTEIIMIITTDSSNCLNCDLCDSYHYVIKLNHK